MSHDHSYGHSHSHGHSHGNGHSHARMCGGVDHNSGSYTPQQRADLDRVLAFNRRMAGLIDAGVDVGPAEAFLDPDPLRYMWVDEGQGRIAEVIAKAHEILDSAVPLPGHTRLAAVPLPGSQRASRPDVALSPSGLRLITWLEWVPGRGDVVRAQVGDDEPVTVSAGVHDVFRPTAVVTTEGIAWVFYGSRVETEAIGNEGVESAEAEGVQVWATARLAEGWSEPTIVSTSASPAFNQEVVALPGGGVEVCWQGRDGNAFAIWSRRHLEGRWRTAIRVCGRPVASSQGRVGVDAGVGMSGTGGMSGKGVTNVWDPTLVASADGAIAYAWSEYTGGAYRVMVRRRHPDGRLDEPRPVSAGTDYALHPNLAVTTDGRLWCAFDVITVAGHGGSGPTRLRPVTELAAGGVDPALVEGMRAPGDSVPPELLPQVSASVRVVQVAAAGVVEVPGGLATPLDVVPSGLPKLVATADGGLTVAYRVHRRLPLMTYYWEVAVQSLLPGDSARWSSPSTISRSDGTLEEVAVAAAGAGAVLVAQTDGRLEHALAWTEGFGGRECPYLMEHQGSVVWHGIHGAGTVVVTELALPGPAAPLARTGPGPGETPVMLDVLEASERVEARRWSLAEAGGRYVADLGERAYTLYWGDLHRHSLVSRCTAGDEPSLEDFYRYAWDVCEYDFWAVTDHSENSTDYQWWSIQKMADLFHVPGRFVPFYGFEWTSADHGHQNVIYGDVGRGAPIFSAFADGSTDPAGLWAGLSKFPEYSAITIPHHPGSAMVRNDWDYFDPRYSVLVEIFQACRGNYEGPGAFRQYSDAIVEGTFTIDGLMRGHKFGLIASSDHGHGASYVGAFAESLDRAAIFDALRSRRTFAATTRDVIVDVRLGIPDGTVFMGEEAALEGPRPFTVRASGYAELARVDIVRNGSVVHAVTADRGLPAGWVTTGVRLEWGGCTETTVWDGSLVIERGEIVPTSFVCPEITAVASDRVEWADTTHSFGELYGAQRGGIDISLAGPRDAVVRVRSGERRLDLTLGRLIAEPHQQIDCRMGHFRLQPGIGGLSGLGVRTLDLGWTDDSTDSAFYYVRVFQVDGEMAWSSPIWVATSPVGAPV